MATAPGNSTGAALYQTINPPLTPGQYCTLSFYYLQTTNGGPLVATLASSANAVVVNPTLPRGSLAQATPDAFNSVADTLPAFPPLWLNELQADNLTGITTAAGAHAPWVELYNPSSNAVSLAGLCLANTYSNLTQWAFPAGSVINPGQFMTVFADGQTGLSSPNELHANFVLSSGSGALALSRLYNGSPQVLDYVNYTNIGPDHSYGSWPDGQSFFRQEFGHATPGATNDAYGSAPLSFVSYSAPGSVYAQDFDSLPNPGLGSINANNPVTINGVVYSLANPFDFTAPPMAAGQNGGLGLPAMSGWFGWGGASSRFGASPGDQTSGGLISFGGLNSANRALGLLATTATGPTAFGVRFINATAQVLDHINVQFTGEVWRQSDEPKTLACYYMVDPAATLSLPTDATALLPALDVAFPAGPAYAGGVPVDGSLPLNQTNLSVTGQAIANWPPGAALWLVWEMSDPAGKGQGLAIDNLAFSANSAGAATNAAPKLGGLRLGAGSLSFSWPGAQGAVYRVQYKDALDAPEWTSLAPDLTGTGDPLSITLPVTANPQRFYRVLLMP